MFHSTSYNTGKMLTISDLKFTLRLFYLKNFHSELCNLDLLLCELRLRCQAVDLSHRGVWKLLVSAPQQWVGVHGCAVGGDAAERNQQLRLSCCSCCVLGLEGRKYLK